MTPRRKELRRITAGTSAWPLIGADAYSRTANCHFSGRLSCRVCLIPHRELAIRGPCETSQSDMKDIRDKFQLNCLGPGILLYMLLTGFGEFASADGIGESLNSSAGISGVSPLADTPAASKRKVSLENYTLDPETATHWKLPRELEEISGLATTGDNRLLAHNDERAIIYEIDFRNGSIVKAFQLSDTNYPAAGDFEGIAATDAGMFLVTSNGRLFQCHEGNAGESVLFNVYTTGVGRDCEIEGLAYDRARRELILICKEARSLEMEGQLALCRWSIDDRRLDRNGQTLIPVNDFSRHIKGKNSIPRESSGIRSRAITILSQLVRSQSRRLRRAGR